MPPGAGKILPDRKNSAYWIKIRLMYQLGLKSQVYMPMRILLVKFTVVRHNPYPQQVIKSLKSSTNPEEYLTKPDLEFLALLFQMGFARGPHNP